MRGNTGMEGGMEDAQTLKGHIAARSWVKYDLWYEIKFNRLCKRWILCALTLHMSPRLCAGLWKDEALKAKISLSYTSAEGAHANMSEVQGWNFSKVRKAAEKAGMNSCLLSLDAPDSVKTAFYTQCIIFTCSPT